MLFSMTHKNHKNLTSEQIIKYVIDRNQKRAQFFEILLKFIGICLNKEIRMIFENPWSEQTHLKEAFLKKPDVIDNNRMTRGDFFVKPTGFWFWNCQPTNGCTVQHDKQKVRLMWQPKNPTPGTCSEERSMISPDYARNWICDFVLGKKQDIGQLSLF